MKTTSLQQALVYTTYAGLILAVLVLVVFAALVRHVSFMVSHTPEFFIELFAMGILTALPLLVFIYTRKTGWPTGLKLVGLFAIKLLVLHVLFELSGMYDYVFSSTSQ
jgi:hypothetical protein